jgi:hypothetical protein
LPSSNGARSFLQTNNRNLSSAALPPASQTENLHSFRDSETLHERLAAFAHGVGNPREIAFFPECFVWIHFEREVAGWAFPWEIPSFS